MLGDLPFDFMLRKSFLGDSECFVYHIALHVDNLDSFLSGDEYFAHYYLYKFKLQSMSSSPYVPNDVKSYMRKYDIEKLINSTVNDLLRNLPQDPYAYMIGSLQKFASASIEIVDVSGVQIISGDGFPAIKIKAVVNYMNKEASVSITQPFSILSEENNLFDQDRLGGKGLNKSLTFLREKLIARIKGLKCEQQDAIDKELQRALTQNGGIGIYPVNSLSYAIVLIRSQVLSTSPYQIFADLAGNKEQKNLKCMVNCLQGGKVIGSKCKVFKYLLVAKNVNDPTLLQNVLQAVRKAIVGGKGGEAALKLSPDGTFVCPLDTIMDNLKIVQDAIIASGGKEHLGIGLSWQADTLFSPDTKKYQLQNPKTPFDNDQMIDYLVKLLTDKPIINYLQDPLASSEKTAWKKLTTKIRQTEALKHVKIGTRSGKFINLLQGDLKAQISELSIDQTADSHPQLTPEARTANNNLKVRLDYVQVRAFEAKTVSNVMRAYKQLKKSKTDLILQDCSLQTYDTTLIDLAYGLDTFSCLGNLSKYDRLSKLNRMREIIDEAKSEKK